MQLNFWALPSVLCNWVVYVSLKHVFLETRFTGLALCFVLATLHKDRTSLERQPGTTEQPQDWDGAVLAY